MLPWTCRVAAGGVAYTAGPGCLAPGSGLEAAPGRLAGEGPHPAWEHFLLTFHWTQFLTRKSEEQERKSLNVTLPHIRVLGFSVLECEG